MTLLPECERKLWGEPHKVRHCYIEKIHGDGKVLFYLAPGSNRPAKYVMWIDSSFIFMDREEEVALIEGGIMDAIIEECGHRDDIMYDEEGNETDEDAEFPALDPSFYTWGWFDQMWEFYSLCESLKNYFNAFSSLGQAIDEKAGRLPALPGGDHG